MARLPEPPDPAALRALLRPDEDVVELPPTTRIVRVFTEGGEHPQRWNSFRYAGPLPHARFDPQPPTGDGLPAETREQGVLYFGLSVRTSIAEVFQASSIVNRTTRSPHLVVFSPRRALRLLDLSALWPTRAGASQEINNGTRNDTQAWARAIRHAHPWLDGLWYRSSMDAGRPAICLWDPPSGSALPAEPDVLVALDHPGLDLPLARICAELNYVLL